uniref:Uncharacterized protein n=1 Tax=Glossina pallidipes TaxID=7398 RepID=A0A1A9ZK33_GLOPL
MGRFFTKNKAPKSCVTEQDKAVLQLKHQQNVRNEIEKIVDGTRECVEKQQETDSLLSEALSEQDKNDVLIELDALVAEEEAEKLKLPEVPQDELSLPSACETLKAAIKEKPKKILIEA